MATVRAFPSGEPISGASAEPVDMKLEVVVIPVADVERSKEFYTKLGWRLDADYDNAERNFKFARAGDLPPETKTTIDQYLAAILRLRGQRFD